MGCHGNGKISYSPNEFFFFFFFFFFLEDITHLVVQIEQFGSHEKLSWGFMVGLISHRPIGTSCKHTPHIKILFWSIKNSGEVLNTLKSREFRATSLSTYDFSTLYTTLPHNLIKEKLINLIEWTFKREGSPYIACNERQAFFTSEDTKRYKLWSCQNVCEALIYLLDNIYIRFGTKLYRRIVGIPMGTNCTPLVADLFLFCYERDFMTSLSDVKQAEIIEAFKSTYRYLDDLLNIDNPYFEGMVNRIYSPEHKQS